MAARFVIGLHPERGRLLYPVGGGEPRSIPGLGAHSAVAWSADGCTLFVREPGLRVLARILRLDVASGRMTPWKELAPADQAGVDSLYPILVAPDGRAYAYTALCMLSDLYLIEGVR